MGSDESGVGCALPYQQLVQPKEAAYQVGRSVDTVYRWLQKYPRIGRRIDETAPWRVDLVGVRIIASGDRQALDRYLAGDIQDPAVAVYLAPAVAA